MKKFYIIPSEEVPDAEFGKVKKPKATINASWSAIEIKDNYFLVVVESELAKVFTDIQSVSGVIEVKNTTAIKNLIQTTIGLSGLKTTNLVESIIKFIDKNYNITNDKIWQ